MPNVIDPEIANYVQKHLQKHGIRVLTGVAAQEVLGDDKFLHSKLPLVN